MGLVYAGGRKSGILASRGKNVSVRALLFVLPLVKDLVLLLDYHRRNTIHTLASVNKELRIVSRK
jgi:hypothetical protein